MATSTSLSGHDLNGLNKLFPIRAFLFSPLLGPWELPGSPGARQRRDGPLLGTSSAPPAWNGCPWKARVRTGAFNHHPRPCQGRGRVWGTPGIPVWGLSLGNHHLLEVLGAGGTGQRCYHETLTAAPSVQFSCKRLFATLWTAARQASLYITNSRSLLKLMSIELVLPSNHLTMYCPLLLPHSIFLSIRVFSNESVLRIRWSKYWSFQM